MIDDLKKKDNVSRNHDDELKLKLIKDNVSWVLTIVLLKGLMYY